LTEGTNLEIGDQVRQQVDGQTRRGNICSLEDKFLLSSPEDKFFRVSTLYTVLDGSALGFLPFITTRGTDLLSTSRTWIKTGTKPMNLATVEAVALLWYLVLPMMMADDGRQVHF
jgi:hypothetical protein